MPGLREVFLGLLVSAAGFLLLERLWPAGPARRFGPGLRTDLVYWFFTPLVTKAFTRVAIVVSASPRSGSISDPPITMVTSGRLSSPTLAPPIPMIY